MRRAQTISFALALGALGALAAGCQPRPYCLNCDDGGMFIIDTGRVDTGPRDVVLVDRQRDVAMCVPTDTAEICNNEDDNCNGQVDETFDLMRDPTNCGACGTICRAPNAAFECRTGRCVLTGCDPGFKDLDTTVDGCEYRCPVFPEGPEICNGLDDDCDGQVDEAADLQPAPAGLCVTTANTPCAGTTAVCATRNGRTTWFCNYAATVEFDPAIPNGLSSDEAKCDGQDGNCDGTVDDSFTMLNAACDNGMIGSCRDGGKIVCDPADSTRTKCDLTVAPDPVPGAPMAETCNGLDDNCDGIVDNSGATDTARVMDDMVHIQRSGGVDFWIYRSEVSHPDATATSGGQTTTRACSRTGVLPWTNVGFDAARAACQAAGRDLCTAAQWQAACESNMTRTYPYGNTYAAMTCNGTDFDTMSGGAIMNSALATGAMTMCVTTEGVADLSGNVKEWTADQQGTSPAPNPRPIYVIRGGSYESPELGLTCQTTLSRATSDTILPSLGFRCCSTRGP